MTLTLLGEKGGDDTEAERMHKQKEGDECALKIDVCSLVMVLCSVVI